MSVNATAISFYTFGQKCYAVFLKNVLYDMAHMKTSTTWT